MPHPHETPTLADLKESVYSLSYGVYLITVGNGPIRSGMTVVWACQLSKDPIRIGIGITPDSVTAGQLTAVRQFCIQVLTAGQEPIAYRFGSSSLSQDEKFGTDQWEVTPAGHPLLPGTLAWMDAEVETITDLGTHLWVTASVVNGKKRNGSPLIYHNGQIKTFPGL
ncbi:MAG: flavin reductase [Bacteroidetes bacterium]|nr:flavin reductase [Bacteroidota bacterium]